MVMLVGEYSVGKTSFIKYLIDDDFPGQRIGPEPTTDRFTVLLNGPEERRIQGHSLSVYPDLPFSGLKQFGGNFLDRGLEGSILPNTVLKNITLVDTPGILSGEKQRVNRGYDFPGVVGWFAERSDLILLMFDAHKLDISDELKETIDVLKGHEAKIRCILNKSDQVSSQELMRVYGALSWNLRPAMNTPEVTRIYVGSFRDAPLADMGKNNAELFRHEEKDLMKDLATLPRQATVQKINELVKRLRRVKTLAYIIDYLKSEMPVYVGSERKQKELIENLPDVFEIVKRRYKLVDGDLPDIGTFSKKLGQTNFVNFHTLLARQMEALDHAEEVDIPKLMELLPSERDSPESLRVKMSKGRTEIPVPATANKFGVDSL